MKFTRIQICLFALAILLFRCATEPASGTPVAGGAVVFTYETGAVRVITNVAGNALTAAAVLFDTDPLSGELAEATALEEGVTVTWPETVSFELPGCSSRPTLANSAAYTTFKIFEFAYPSDCTPATNAEVAGQAALVISKDGNSKTISDSASTVTEQTYTSSGTWTAPVGVTSLVVETWGGGGGGGGADVGGNFGGNGGGGGGYSRKLVAVTPGNVYTVTVGAAGSGVGDVTTSGGDGNLNVISRGGGGGSSGGTSANGNDGAMPAGAGGVGGAAPVGGGAGGSGGNHSQVGVDGFSPGGGGGGGGGNGSGYAGGTGANGKIILDWE